MKKDANAIELEEILKLINEIVPCVICLDSDVESCTVNFQRSRTARKHLMQHLQLRSMIMYKQMIDRNIRDKNDE